MGEQTLRSRVLVEALDGEFARLHQQSVKLVRKSNPDSASELTENVLRSAAAIERTFGGLTANLWDDPFEWTLPETLSNPDKIVEYLNEVEDTRLRGFAVLKTDADLFKQIATPADELQTLITVLLKTLVRAARYQGRASSLAKI